MLHFDPKLTDLMAALSDLTRCAIVERLAVEPLTVSEIAAPFDMSLAAIIQHIQILERAGAIFTVKEGRTRHCMINARGMSVLKNWIHERERAWQQQFANLEAHLDARGGSTAEAG